MTDAKRALLTALLTIKTPDDLDAALIDLLTPKEYADLAERFAILTQLRRGATVKDVCEKLGVASATVVRGNRVLKYGAGGAEKLFGRTKKKE